MATTFYNSDGRAVAYIDNDGESVYLYDGSPVAFVVDDSIYAYGGQFLGWFADGWVTARNGQRVFFTDEASGGPAKPARQVKPVRSVRRVRPVRDVREVRPAGRTRLMSWSDVSHEGFFTAS